jgi:DNA-binding transcriptional ArsR family regulator
MTSADLARVGFETSPLVNLVRGLDQLGSTRPMRSAHRRWLAGALRQIPERCRPLMELLNAIPNYAPAFLIPDLPQGGRLHRGLDDELDALRAVRDTDLALDFTIFDTWERRPSRAYDALRDRGERLIPVLTDAMHALYTACLADDWPDIRRTLDADIGRRARQMATDGPGAVLNDLHPKLSWEPEQLSLAVSKVPDWRYDLRGDGVTFSPSVFGHYVGSLIAPGRRSIMAYPVSDLEAAAALSGEDTAQHDGLAALIGRARAAALRAIGDDPTTGELALRLGVKAPTASAHAAALRAAGLVVTERTGRSVRHRLTGLGAELIAANRR